MFLFSAMDAISGPPRVSKYRRRRDRGLSWEGQSKALFPDVRVPSEWKEGLVAGILQVQCLGPGAGKVWLTVLLGVAELEDW